MQLDAIEKEGETVDEALQYALEELEVDSDSVEYEVLEAGEPGDEEAPIPNPQLCAFGSKTRMKWAWPANPAKNARCPGN